MKTITLEGVEYKLTPLKEDIEKKYEFIESIEIEIMAEDTFKFVAIKKDKSEEIDSYWIEYKEEMWDNEDFLQDVLHGRENPFATAELTNEQKSQLIGLLKQAKDRGYLK